jgi:hypothetical protein
VFQGLWHSGNGSNSTVVAFVLKLDGRGTGPFGLDHREVICPENRKTFLATRIFEPNENPISEIPV